MYMYVYIYIYIYIYIYLSSGAVAASDSDLLEGGICFVKSESGSSRVRPEPLLASAGGASARQREVPEFFNLDF